MENSWAVAVPTRTPSVATGDRLCYSRIVPSPAFIISEIRSRPALLRHIGSFSWDTSLNTQHKCKERVPFSWYQLIDILCFDWVCLLVSFASQVNLKESLFVFISLNCFLSSNGYNMFFFFQKCLSVLKPKESEETFRSDMESILSYAFGLQFSPCCWLET